VASKRKARPRVRKLGASECKSHFLAVLRDVRKNGREVVITHRGEEVARLVPSRARPFGSSRGMFKGRYPPAGRDIAEINFADDWKTVENWDALFK